MATRNFVPRNDGEGSIGTATKQWSDIQAKEAHIGNRNILTDGTKLDTHETEIDILQTKVTTLEHAYAGAKAAATVADMTDHNQIYVYVGSESGYTNGNWYYWNGTAWTSGGVYNATALETDKTLTVSGAAADSATVGDFFSPMLFDGVITEKTQIINGYYINIYNGAITPYKTNDFLTQYIPMLKGKQYKITATADSGNIYRANIYLYNSSKVYQGFIGGNEDMNEYVFTAQYYGYLRVSSSDSIPIVSGKTYIAENAIEYVNEHTIAPFDLITAVRDGLYLNKFNGSEAKYPTIDYRTSNLIKLLAGETYKIYAVKDDSNDYMATVFEYNENGTPKGLISSSTLENYEYKPQKNEYVKLCSFGRNPSLINEECKPKELLPILTTNATKNKFIGKKILWLGTSIPAGTESNNYPSMVGRLLDCTVINKALGNSSLRTGMTSRVSITDPLGISHGQWEVATRSLSASVAQKQYIIDHWDDTYGPNGTDNLYQAPSTLTQEQIDIIIGSSYENRLAPYIDYSNAVDLIIIDHGWNDAAWGSDLDIIPEGEDIHTFVGAMDFILRKIFEKNTRQRVLLIGHYENDNRPDLCQAQELVSDRWGIPLLDLWNKSGISSMMVGNKSMIEWLCPDTLHPHSDTTGLTNMMLAKIIASWLNDNF